MTPSNGVDEMLALADELHSFCASAPQNYPGHNIELFERAERAIRASARPAVDGGTTNREELAIDVMNVRRRIHGLDDLDLTTLRRIKSDAGINEAFAIADALLARLAAKPADPDAQNYKRMLEDMKLTHNVRGATIKECAAIAKAHKGAAQRARRAKGKRLYLGVDGYDEIVAEERGEDIASEIIERNIRSLSSTGERKPSGDNSLTDPSSMGWPDDGEVK